MLRYIKLVTMMNRIRIATRRSPLALWQANHVRQLLEGEHPGLQCELVGMTTEGDRNKHLPLDQMGGKGVFVKALEKALMDHTADVAVHSMKDVPGELPAGLAIGAICKRANARDALVSNHWGRLDALPDGARVGSSSLRRILQIKLIYPALEFHPLRGNVDTRMHRLDQGDYDAIILAVAGLHRLGLAGRVTEEISTDVCIPAAGQGAVGIECREDDSATIALLTAIDDPDTSICVTAERHVTRRLCATCNLPVAVFAEEAAGRTGRLSISAFVSDPEGQEIITDRVTGKKTDAMEIAGELGERLLSRGAGKLIAGAG